MRENGATLLAAEMGTIVDDVEEGGMDFSDVVEERDALEGAHATPIEVSRVTQDECVAADAAKMLSRFRVGGFDAVEQRLQGSRGETLGAFSPNVLISEQAE
jgi:hypothetical protein